MSAPVVLYAGPNELATLSNLFAVDGSPVDPTTVGLAVTDPHGATETYAYAATIDRTGTGAYRKDVPVPLRGLWSYLWSGTGAASDDESGSFWVLPPQQRLYAALDQLKNALTGRVDGLTNRDQALMINIASASRGIDRITGRRFWRDAEASSRVLRTRGRIPDRCSILLPDLATDDDLVVEVGSTSAGWTQVDDWELPELALVDGRPITGLERPGGFESWPRVRITGIWGFPELPDDVHQACLLQASRLYRRKDSPEGVTGSAEWGAVRVARIDPDVQAMISPFILDGFGG